MTDCQPDLSRRGDLVAEAECDLRNALAVDPPPQFAARVRARIAEEPARVDRRFGFRFWMPVAAGAVAAVAVAMLVSPERSNVGPARVDVLASRSFGIATASLPSAVPMIVHGDATPPMRVRTNRSEPEILISPSESRAILNLIAGLRTGRIDPSSLPAAAPVVDLAIQPIVIAPLSAVDGAEGVRQ